MGHNSLIQQMFIEHILCASVLTRDSRFNKGSWECISRHTVNRSHQIVVVPLESNLEMHQNSSERHTPMGTGVAEMFRVKLPILSGKPPPITQ